MSKIVPQPKPKTAPENKPTLLLELTCSECKLRHEVRCTLDKEGWPLHRCRAIGRAAPFTKGIPADKAQPRSTRCWDCGKPSGLHAKSCMVNMPKKNSR